MKINLILFFVEKKPDQQHLTPFKALIVSNLPIGQGLSSSAALEVAFLYFLEGLVYQQFNFKLNLRFVEIKRSQKSEKGERNLIN